MSPPSREGSKAREQRPFHLSVCSQPHMDELYMKFQQEEPEEDAVVETVEAFPSFAFRPSVGCMMMPHFSESPTVGSSSVADENDVMIHRPSVGGMMMSHHRVRVN